jgi:hypothetical protein
VQRQWQKWLSQASILAPGGRVGQQQSAGRTHTAARLPSRRLCVACLGDLPLFLAVADCKFAIEEYRLRLGIIGLLVIPIPILKF